MENKSLWNRIKPPLLGSNQPGPLPNKGTDTSSNIKKTDQEENKGIYSDEYKNKMWDFLFKYKNSEDKLPVNNNNPYNVKRSAKQGEINSIFPYLYQTDKEGHLKFNDPKEGFETGGRLLEDYFSRPGITLKGVQQEGYAEDDKWATRVAQSYNQLTPADYSNIDKDTPVEGLDKEALKLAVAFHEGFFNGDKITNYDYGRDDINRYMGWKSFYSVYKALDPEERKLPEKDIPGILKVFAKPAEAAIVDSFEANKRYETGLSIGENIVKELEKKEPETDKTTKPTKDTKDTKDIKPTDKGESPTIQSGIGSGTGSGIDSDFWGRTAEDEKKERTGVGKFFQGVEDFRQTAIKGFVRTWHEGIKRGFGLGLYTISEATEDVLGIEDKDRWLERKGLAIAEKAETYMKYHPELWLPEDFRPFFKGGWKDVQNYGEYVGGMVGYSLPMAILALLPGGRTISFTTMSLVETGNAYSYYTEEAGMDEEDAVKLAPIVGVINAKIENSFGVMPSKAATGMIKGGKIAGAAKMSVSKFMLEAFKKAGITALEEGGEEIAQKLVQDFAPIFINETVPEITKEYLGEYAENFAGGFIGGWAMGGGRVGGQAVKRQVDKTKEKIQTKQQEKRQPKYTGSKLVYAVKSPDKSAVTQLGEGTYVTRNPKSAAKLGTGISKAMVDLENPLVFKTNEKPQKFGYKPVVEVETKDGKRDFKRVKLSDWAKEQGYDAIVLEGLEENTTIINILKDKDFKQVSGEDLKNEAKEYESAQEFMKAKEKGEDITEQAGEAIAKEIKAIEPQKASGIKQKEFLNKATVGKGDYRVGEVYEQELETGNVRPVQITKVNEDGTFDGWYLGSGFKGEVKAFKGTGNLIPGYNFTKEQLLVPPYDQAKLNEYVSKAFNIKPALTSGLKEEAKEVKETKEPEYKKEYIKRVKSNFQKIDRKMTKEEEKILRSGYFREVFEATNELINRENLLNKEEVNKTKKEITKGERPTILTKFENGISKIIDGFNILEAYKSLGIKEVPAIQRVTRSELLKTWEISRQLPGVKTSKAVELQEITPEDVKVDRQVFNMSEGDRIRETYWKKDIGHYSINDSFRGAQELVAQLNNQGIKTVLLKHQDESDIFLNNKYEILIEKKSGISTVSPKNIIEQRDQAFLDDWMRIRDDAIDNDPAELFAYGEYAEDVEMEELKGKYQSFKSLLKKNGMNNMGEKAREVLISQDLDAFVNGNELKREGKKAFYQYEVVKKEAKNQGLMPKNYLSQLFNDNDEIFNKFRERLAKEDPALLFGSKDSKAMLLEKIYDNDIDNEVKTTKNRKGKGYENLNEETKQEMTTFPLPKRLNVSYLFSLEGNKRASLPVFEKLIQHYVQDEGRDIFVEAYGGGFNLALFAVAKDEILNSGLKEYHVNIFDSAKRIILKKIVDTNFENNKLKALYFESREKLNREILKVAKDFPNQLKVINKFLEENPRKYIGGEKWIEFVKGINKEDSKIVLEKNKGRRKEWAKLFNKAIKNLYFEEDKKKGKLLENLGETEKIEQAIMNEFLVKAGVRTDASQHFVTKDGFRDVYTNLFHPGKKYSISKAIDVMYDSLNKIKNSNVKLFLHTEDGGELVNRLKVDNKRTFYYFDPPYLTSADVYKDLENRNNFLSGDAFIKSHKRAFDGDAAVILTNDIEQEWIDSMKKRLGKISLFGYKEWTTPTSLIFTGDYKNELIEHINSLEQSGMTGSQKFLETFRKTKKKFYINPERVRILSKTHGDIIPENELIQYERSYADYYLKQKATGESWKIKKELISRGVSSDTINQLEIEGQLLKNISQISRTNKDIDSIRIASKKTIQYMLDNSNIEKVNPDDVVTKKDLTKKQKLLNFWNYIEVPSKFFRRLGDGFYNVIFDPVDSAERRATTLEHELIDRLQNVFSLGKVKSISKLKGLEETESVRVGKYALQKQGVKIPKDQQVANLTEKEKKAYRELQSLFKWFYPKVKKAASKRGIDLNRIQNYSPMYLKSDIDVFRYGDFYKATRNDPYFGSLEERRAKLQWDMYETDIRKVMDVWIQNASRYVEMSEVTSNLKFLLLNKDFKSNVPEYIQKSIVNWLDYVISGGKDSPKIIRMLRKAQGTFILGLRYAVMVKQFLNLLDAAVFMKKGDMLKALKYTIENRKSFFVSKEAKQRVTLPEYINNSAAIRQRMIDITMMDLNGTILDVIKKPVMWADRATARIIKLTFMRKMIDERKAKGIELDAKSFKKIEKFTDNLIGGLMGAISRSETPRGLTNEWGKNIFMFYSQLNAKMGYHIQDIWLQQNKELFTEFNTSQRSSIISSLTALILAAFFENLISKLYPGDDPEEIAEETLYTLLGNFPLLGPLSFSVRTGKPFMPAPLVANMIYFFQEASLINKSVKESTKKKHLLNAMWTLMGFGGIPRQLKNTIEGIQISTKGKLDIGNETIYLHDWYDYFLTVLNGKYGSVKVQKWLQDNY